MREPSPETNSIFIIDDEVSNVEPLASARTQKGYMVFRAETGEEGLGTLAREKNDLVLLDILMPGLDGFETLSRIRVHKKIKNLPANFFTSFMRDAHGGKIWVESKEHIGSSIYLTLPLK